MPSARLRYNGLRVRITPKGAPPSPMPATSIQKRRSFKLGQVNFAVRSADLSHGGRATPHHKTSHKAPSAPVTTNAARQPKARKIGVTTNGVTIAPNVEPL